MFYSGFLLQVLPPKNFWKPYLIFCLPPSDFLVVKKILVWCDQNICLALSTVMTETDLNILQSLVLITA